MDLADLERRLVDASEQRLQALTANVLRAAGADLVARGRQLAAARLKERSRALVSSIRAELGGSGGLTVLRFLAGGDAQGLRVPYARLQEYGGQIRPVRSKYLAVPVDKGLTAAGTPRYLSPRQMPFAAFRPVKGRKARFVVFDKRNGEVFFVLLTDTEIPAHRFMRDALDEVLPGLPRQLAMATERLIGEA